MRVSKRASVVAALICIAALLFTGCDKIESIKKATGTEADILESAYFYDEDTGAYRTVAIVQNNTMNPIKMGFIVARAYDENGERIEHVMDGEMESPLLGSYYWLCIGEKSAVILCNDGYSDDPFFNILSHYTAVPATLEWENDGGSRQDPELVPHGLSITGIEPYYDSSVWFEGDYAEYTATIHNGSETDYTFDDGAFEYIWNGKKFSFNIVAVYRNAEGEICDMQEMQYTGINGMPDLPAGSDTELYVFANHTVKDDSLTPEYYISITDLTDEVGE